MAAVNPTVVLRNHVAQAVIAAAELGNFAPVRQLHNVCYNVHSGCERVAVALASMMQRQHAPGYMITRDSLLIRLLHEY
jgi:uncharacterized protein YdiU (UPF0061 family)